jgi:hypothetical protein
MLKTFIATFFSWYIKAIIQKDFSAFSYTKVELDRSRSILLLSNHFSWWDGFLMFQLNKLYFKKNFHVMVSEDNYKKFSFLKYLGAFPIEKNSRNLIKSLEHAGNLLKDAENLVLIFPQGKLYSNHVEDIEFQKGLMKIVNLSPNKFQYLFAASFVDYFNKRKPSVFCYLQSWASPELPDLALIKDAYNKHYEASRRQQSRIKV